MSAVLQGIAGWWAARTAGADGAGGVLPVRLGGRGSFSTREVCTPEVTAKSTSEHEFLGNPCYTLSRKGSGSRPSRRSKISWVSRTVGFRTNGTSSQAKRRRKV